MPVASIDDNGNSYIAIIIGVLLFPLRFVLLSLILTCWFLSHCQLWLFSLVLSVPPRWCFRLTDCFHGQCFHFILNGSWVSVQKLRTYRPVSATTSFQDVVFTSAAGKDAASTAHGKLAVEAGDLLLCNCESPLDVLCLMTLYSPQFTRIASDGSKAVIRECSALASIMGNADVDSDVVQSLDSMTLRQQRKCPVVVFVEGTSTNGRGLLAPAISMQTLMTHITGPQSPEMTNSTNSSSSLSLHRSMPRIHVVGVSQSRRLRNVALPIASTRCWIQLICRLLGRFRIPFVSNDDAPVIVKWIPFDVVQSLLEISGDCGDDMHRVLWMLSKILVPRRQLLSLSLTDKATFLQCYFAHQSSKSKLS